MDRLFEVMTELSIDPVRFEAFSREPARHLAEAGLSAEEQLMVLGWLQGQRRINGNAMGMAAVLFDPGDDPLPDPDVPTISI